MLSLCNVDPAGGGNFLFTTVSRPSLGATQSPVQWVPGSFPFPGGKATGAWSWPLSSI